MPAPLTQPIHDAPIYFPTVASIAYEIGDLVYDNGAGSILPASSQVDQLTEPLNQHLFARRFVGVCHGQKLASDDSTRELPVIVNQDVRLTSVSSIFAIGDFVGADEAASGTALEDQQVRKVTDANAAIGVVVHAEADATTKVWVRPLSKFNLQRQPVGLQVKAQTIAMGDAAVVLTKIVGSPAGTLLTGNWLLVDAESGLTENLDLPPEADMVDELLLIKNTGGETINLRTDAGAAVATIATGETCFVHCDGANWTVMQHVFTT